MKSANQQQQINMRAAIALFEEHYDTLMQVPEELSTEEHNLKGAIQSMMVNKHFFKYHSSTPRVIKDNKTGSEWSSIIGDRCRLYNLIWNWIVKDLPEHGMTEIKVWMRKNVTAQRLDPTFDLVEFTEELNKNMSTRKV